MQLARLRPGAARFLVGATLVAATLPALGQTVLMGVHPLFDGLMPGTGVVPVEVNLANTGPDARGMVRVSTGSYSMTYPVELPQGTKKTLITYPDCGDYAAGPIQYSLITNRGTIHQSMEANGVGRQQLVIGEVAENVGDLGFLRTQRDYSSMTPQDAYVKPAHAPDRIAGYERLSFLVLGDGAERLSNDSVEAIKLWMLGGGTLIFVGGASAPILNDPRWGPALPVQNATQKNFEGSKSLEKRYGSSPKPFTAMVGTPVAGATTRADGLVMERPFGLGRSIYLAFNPFENPLNAWGSRQKLFSEIMSPALITGPQMVISSVVNLQGNNPYSRYGGYYGGYNPYEQASASNPFTATLPETSKVLMILACYFFAVVPLNFLVLRKLKRGELAWASAPLLSLGFAGIFFASAQGLYTAQLSTSTKGVLLVQQGDPNALIYGHSQVYFPRGGRYDLKFKGVDALLETSDDPYRTYGRYGGRERHSVYEDLEPVDNGEIRAGISVPNLAFREMSYRERAKIAGWFDVKRKANGNFLIVNHSDYVLVNARLAGGGGIQLIGDIKPGQSEEVAFDQPTMGNEDLSSRLAQHLIRSRGVALTGRIRGYRAGPRVGSEVNESNGLTLALVTNEKLKQEEMIRQTSNWDQYMP